VAKNLGEDFQGVAIFVRSRPFPEDPLRIVSASAFMRFSATVGTSEVTTSGGRAGRANPAKYLWPS